jgi:L-lactate dehydrogenase complex protein LldE
MVREQYPELARESGETALLEELDALAVRTFELSEFLVQVLGVDELGAFFPQSVTFHPTCHSIRSIHVGDAPLRLLKGVEGLELIPLPKAEECCGFGGTFSAKNSDTSVAMMEDKIRSVQESGARVLTAVDNSCLLHLAGGMRRMGVLASGDGFGAGGSWSGEGIRVMHLAEILASRKGGGVR